MGLVLPNIFKHDIGHAIKTGFHAIFLWLDAILYELVSQLYKIFELLASQSIFKQDFYKDFSQHIYVILGVVMLFVLTYSLLKAMVDPEQLTKGDKGISKMVPTFVVSLVLCGVLPSIFDFAYALQNFLLRNNTIGVLVFGNSVANKETDVTFPEFGNDLSITALSTFIDTSNSDGNFGTETVDSINAQMKQGDFMGITSMADEIADGNVVYRWGISTLVACFLIYVLATFCLDLAVRAVRLSFLQLIAPIPIIMRVLPTKNDVFKNWSKKTIATYLEVFVRLLIMYLGIYFISYIRENNLNWFSTSNLRDANTFTIALTNLLIIMGILMFVKEFPKLLSEVAGVESGKIRLGFKDFMEKLQSGGAFVAGAAFTAGGTGLIRGFNERLRRGVQSGNVFKAMGNALLSPFSAVASGLSAGTRAGIKGVGAKNLSEANKARAEGLNAQEESRDKRRSYRASHSGFLGVTRGHIADTGRKVGQYFGITQDLASLKRQQEILADGNSKRKAAWDTSKAEMLKTVAQRTTTNTVEANGRVFNNLAELDNLIETAKTKGITGMRDKLDDKGNVVKDDDGNVVQEAYDLDSEQLAEYITRLQAVRSDLEDNLTMDYIMGWNYDKNANHGRGGMVHDINKINGQALAQLISANTALANNVDIVNSNLSDTDMISLSSQIETMNRLISKTGHMSKEEFMQAAYNGDIGELMEAMKKVSGAAEANVQARINQEMEKAQKEKKS